MSLKGISQDEIFILDRNIGNQDSGFSAQNSYQDVVKVLIKAIKEGNTLEEIAINLNLQSTTMLYRHVFHFENLDAKYKFIRYGSSEEYKNDKKGIYIGFQMANELARIQKNNNLKFMTSS